MKTCPQCRKNYDDKTQVCPDDNAPLVQSAASSDPMVGRVLADRYRVIQKIGEGGMGSIYKAVHTRMDRVCAVKLLTNLTGDHATSLARFNREARMASSIDNPHAVTIYDYGETEDGTPYLAMEFIDGKPLSHLLTKENKLDPERAVNITNQVALALAAAHTLEIVHRDLKPDNIMLTQKGGERDYVKVLDFGIAKTMTEDSTDNVTKTGFVLGTPVYMSPEQLSGEKVDARSDIYSLAIIVYEMLSGQIPFEGENTQAIMIKRIMSDPIPLRTYLPTISEPLEHEVMTALERNRSKRHQSAKEFAERLNAALGPVTESSSPRKTTPISDGGTAEWASYNTQAEPSKGKSEDATVAFDSLSSTHPAQGAPPAGKQTDGTFTRVDTSDPPPAATRQEPDAQSLSSAKSDPTIADDHANAPVARAYDGGVARQPGPPAVVESRPRKSGMLILAGSAAGLAIIALILYLLLASGESGFTIVVEGAPPGSEVFVNNVRRGAVSSDGTLELTGLDEGDSSVRVSREGFADFNEVISGKVGEERTINASLMPLEIDYGGEMVLIPAGDFIMGSDDHSDIEKPQRKVSVPYAFYIDKYEVTIAEYKRFRQPPNDPLNTNDNGPVLGVNFDQAVAYASSVGKRLPTEEEWEKAASWDPLKQQKNLWPWGNEPDPSRANIASADIDRSRTPVAVRQSGGDRSAYGVYGMGGNAWEWVNSFFEPYEGSPAKSPNFGKNYHVVRGGNFILGVNDARTTARNWLPTEFPQGMSTPVSFRCAISADDPKIQPVLAARRK